MAKLVICKTCGAEIAKSAKVCPHCGGKVRKNSAKAILLTIVLFVVLCAIINGGMTEGEKKELEESINDAVSQKITEDEYDSVDFGMTYDEVKEIVGGTGEIISESSVGGSSAMVVSYYGVTTGANANFTFLDGKVSAKSQIGVKSSDTK